MKNLSRFFVILALTPLLLVGAFFVSQNIKADTSGGGGGCGSSPTPGTTVPTSSSDVITLNPGWNIVSTPKVLSSHQFSADETPANFNILLLDPTDPSGWKTMGGEGQTEFQPLFAYFINNGTGQTQTLTFNYNLNLSPAQRLFQRTLKPGWNGIGIALPDSTIQWAHQNPYSGAVSAVLNQINSSALATIDFTANQTDLNSVGVSSQWNVRTSLGANDVSSLQNLKGYGTYIAQSTSLLMGYENLSETEYNLTYAAGQNGSVTGNLSQTVYAGLNGTTVTAVPDAGYQFTGWSGTDCSTQNQRTDTGVQSNINVTANFAAIPVIATADFPTGNTASPSNEVINDGSTNQILWSQNINISTHTVLLSGMTVKMIGSAPSNALENVGLYVDGTQVATALINANSQYVFNASSAPIPLPTGSHLLEVHGDLVSGSSRTFYLSLEQGSDIILKDSQSNTSILVTSQGNTAANINGGTITINGTNGGSVTIQQDPSFNNTTTLVGGATNVTMASWIFTAYGEDEKITDLKFNPIISGTASTLTNIGLYINGAQVGSNQTVTNGQTLEFSNLGSNLIVPSNSSVTVSIKGDAIATGGINFTTGNVEFDLLVGSNNAQGESSELLTSTPAESGQSLSVVSTNVIFAATTGFTTSMVIPNSVNIKIGEFTLQTNSAEGVLVNNIVVALPGSIVSANQLTNLTVRNGATVLGTPIGQPVIGNNNFSVNIPVSVNSSTEFDIYGDIGSASNGLNVTPSMAVTYRGATSNLTGTTPVVSSVQTTVGLPTISASGVTLGSSLSSQFVTGNAGPLQIATFNVKSNGVGGATLRDLTFVSVNNSIASVTVNGITRSVSNNTVTVPNIGITVPGDSYGRDIPVTVQLVCIGSGCSGASNTPVQLSLTKLTYLNGSSVQTLGDGTNPINNAPDVGSISAQLTLVGSMPTVAMTSSSNAGLVIGNQQIATFTIAAGVTGDIKIQDIPFTTSLIGTTSMTTGSVVLYDANGNTLSNPPSNNGLSGSGIFTFSNPFTITAGTAQTFTVYAGISGPLGSAGTSSVTSTLGDKNNFQWTDVTGNTSGITGSGIFGWPTSTQSKTN